jgi:hypothetical protein
VDKKSGDWIKCGPGMMRRIRTAEEWQAVRSLVEGEMTLKATAKKTGISYGAIQRRASYECWGLQHSKGRPKLFSEDRIRALEANLDEEEAIVRAEVALGKAEDVELLARKSLIQHSARAKVMISRRVTEILSRLEDPSVPVRSAAQALGALAPVIKLIYHWQDEPSQAELSRMKTGMINLDLIHTSPDQLKQLAEKRGLLSKSGQAACDQNQKKITRPAALEPLADKGPPGDPSRGPRPEEKKKKKKTEPAKKNLENTPEEEQDQPATPGSPEWHRQQLDTLARQRADWRNWRH